MHVDPSVEMWGSAVKSVHMLHCAHERDPTKAVTTVRGCPMVPGK